MRRREFIALIGIWPLAARAERIARVGYLGLTSADSVQASRIEAFRGGLRRLGYVEGKNIEIEFRFAQGNSDRLPSLAAELINLHVDVLVTYATGVCRPSYDHNNSNSHGYLRGCRCDRSCGEPRKARGECHGIHLLQSGTYR